MDQGYAVSCTSWNGKVQAPVPEVFVVNLDKDFGVTDVGGKQFPCVLAIEIIEHLENPAAFLRNVHGLLADQGILILSTPNIESALSRIQVALRGFPSAFSSEEVRKNRHIAMLHRHLLEYFFEKAGLIIRECHFVPKETYKLDGLRALLKHALLVLLRRIMRGQTEGACRIYVSVKGSPTPENAADFY
jgi:SAM-dependent methyltransferase